MIDAIRTIGLTKKYGKLPAVDDLNLCVNEGEIFGFMIFTLVLAQIVAATGYGHFFPWAVPALASGINKNEGSVVETASIIIVLLTSSLGLTGTLYWWSHADQS